MKHTLICNLYVSMTLYAASVQAQDVSWPTSRHDQDRTARSTGQGAIAEPGVAWTLDLGGRLGSHEAWIGNLAGDAQKEFALVVFGRVILKTASDLVIWVSDPIGATGIVGSFDFDGDGARELLVTSHGLPAALSILDASTGSLIWRFDSFGDGALTLNADQVLVADLTGDDLPEIVCSARINDQPTHAFSFDAGFMTDPTLNELWSYENTTYAMDLSYVAGDVDADGATEVVFVESTHITILDGVTGSPDAVAAGVFLDYSAGLLQVADVDSDPQPEILVVSNTSYDYAIAVYDAVDGAVTWQYQWHPTAWKSLAVTGNSLLDLDGDGALEIVVSVFNDSDDEHTSNASAPSDYDGVSYPDRWVLLVLDAATGTVEASVPDRYLSGVVRANLLDDPLVLTQVASAPSPIVPGIGTTASYRHEGSSLTPLWTIENSSVTALPADAIPSLSGPPIAASHDYDGDGTSDLLILADTDADTLADRLQAASLASSTPSIIATLPLDPHELASPLAIGDAMSSPASTDETAIFRTSGSLEVLSSDLSTAAGFEAGQFTFSPIAADLDADGEPEIVVAVSTNEIQALDTSSGTPAVIWSYHGGSEPILTSYDVDGDSAFELAVRNTNDAQNPSILLLDGSGGASWTRPLPGFGSVPQQIVFADLDGDPVHDVVTLAVDVREGSATDLRLVGLDGTSGSIRWNVPTARNIAVASSILPVSYPAPTDESILVIDVDTIELFDSADGSLLDSFSYTDWGTAGMLLDIDGDGEKELRFNSRADDQGILTWDVGTEDILYSIPLDYTAQLEFRYASAFDDSLPVEGFIQTYPEGFLVAYHGNGSVLWGPLWLRNGALLTSDPGGSNDIRYVSVADIDGDGSEDVLVGTFDGYLSAIRISDASLVWSIPLYSPVNEPVLADADGDGLLEILTVTSNGMLNVIDESTLEAPSLVRDVALSSSLELVDPLVDIDLTEVRIALGASWEPAAGAAGYRVMAIDRSGIQLIPWQDVGSSTSHVISTAPLPLESTYHVVVVAYDSSGSGSPETRSDGVFLTDATPPTIDLFEADPSIFNPLSSSTTLVLQAHDPTWIASWEIRIDDPDDVTVISWDGEPYATTVDLSQPWDGTDSSSAAVPDGTYTGRATVTDLAGHTATASCEIVVDRTPADADADSEDVDGDEGPSSGFEARGGGCTCGIAG